MQLNNYGMDALTRGVRSRLFWTPAPVLTNQTLDPAPGQCLLFILLLLFDSCFYAKVFV